MDRQRIRHLFPGSNTAAGFVGFFEELRQGARRTVILKGGPGVGKSSLMAAVGKHFEDLNTPVSYYHCSGDPDSLDAVFAPQAGFLILDGTAPHVIDPRLPGARDGILNLGVCLDENQLANQAEEIGALTHSISLCYAQATRYLQAARALRSDAAEAYRPAWRDKERRDLEREMFSLLPAAPEGDEEHLFAQAVTCQGMAEHMDSVWTERVYSLNVPWGFDVDSLLAPLWREACRRRLQRTAYHDPLDADGLHHLTVGGTVFTIASLMDAPTLTPQLDAAVLSRESQRLAFDKAVYDLTLNQATETLAQAKALHDRLERYYIDAMDYARLESIKHRFLSSLPQ